MKRHNFPILPAVVIFLFNETVIAFDDDKTISDIHLKNESFLDINANQFRKSLDLQWLDTVNGLRAAGGSISTDRAFLQTDIRLNRQVFQALQFGLELEQDNFYAPKPVPLPLFYADVYPAPAYNAAISFLGTPAYDKRQSDIGYAITFGHRPRDYLRLSWLKVDLYYNEKNDFDDSYYKEFGETLKLETSTTFNQKWTVYIDMQKDRPLDFVFENQASRFTHESHDYSTSTVYHLSAWEFAGFNLRDMQVDKSLLENTSLKKQQIDYQKLDIYWVNERFRANQEVTIGFRYDHFTEALINRVNPDGTYDFKLTTWQVYSSILHNYNIHQAWDLGLYLAWSERSKLFLTPNPDEFDDKGIEAKLRTSWQYHSIDKRSVLLLSISFNLDNLKDKPGDGGGIYLQSRL